jgi:hypothetical protein
MGHFFRASRTWLEVNHLKKYIPGISESTWNIHVFWKHKQLAARETHFKHSTVRGTLHTTAHMYEEETVLSTSQRMCQPCAQLFRNKYELLGCMTALPINTYATNQLETFGRKIQT